MLTRSSEPPDAVLRYAPHADGVVDVHLPPGPSRPRPLVFLVDGAPVPGEPARRQASWLPPGPGFYGVTVLDADGAAVRAAVRVR